MGISAANKAKAKQLVAQMTLAEKAKLHSGNGAWHTEAIERLGLKGAMMTDGPHGLRKEIDETKPFCQENSVKATCFPAAVSTSCSFDKELFKEMGVAMAEECLAENVQIILGPAANIKRSPLCGRNFEYISEDPFLAGSMASALIKGIQSKNVGTSLKHYLANSQETGRHTSNSVIDERTLREIYLTAFEMVVKESQPYTVMCSYNKVNGIYASVQERMLRQILKEEWGFEGFVVSDWGAMDHRATSVKAGLDLEMPGRASEFDLDIVEAVENGELDEKYLDQCCERIVRVVLQTIDNKIAEYSVQSHHELARRVARESAVLLRNENNTLPLSKSAKIALIGEFAVSPRYQGAGSSLINPNVLNSAYDEFTRQSISFTYARGYNKETDETDTVLLNEAVEVAKNADVIVATVGLPDIYESEGYDRKHINMPKSHNDLINELAKLGKPLVAVIMAGSAVAIDWRNSVDSILLMNLGGENIGGAMYDLLFGDYSPCGKLAETYPLSLADTPSYKTFGSKFNVEYRESLFVGYRYYDTAKRDVAYPFGFGLSYSEFEYKNIQLSSKHIKDTDKLTVTATIKNVGKMAAKEIVQLYVNAPCATIFRPVHELKGFVKVELMPNEEKQVKFTLDKRDFSYYNVNISDWHVISGDYTIELASSSRDIRLCDRVTIDSTVTAEIPDYRSTAPMYYSLNSTGELDIPHEQYAALFTDKSAFNEKQVKPFNRNTTLREMLTDPIAAELAQLIIKRRLRQRSLTVLGEEYYDAPMRSSMFPYHPMTRATLKAFITWANGGVDEAKRIIEQEGIELE